jgi:Mn-dependent DtxR family transcriptional regulator
MRTDVQGTSIRAYRSENRNTVIRAVARHILALKRHGKNASIGAIARALNMDKSSASGRLNDLKKMESITVDAVAYKLVPMGTEYDAHTRKTVQMWTMEPLDPKPTAPTAQQTKLF